MSLVKKIINNKIIILVLTISVICLIYTGIKKLIDNYQFKNDIVRENSENDELDEKILKDSQKEFINQNSNSNILNDETDLVMEEQEDMSKDDTYIIDENNQKESNTDDSETVRNKDMYFSDNNKIYIYITGEVNVPGVIILNEGSRIVDAINAAGGTTEKANLSKVNLVYILEDGMKVNIPSDNDLKNNSNFEYITMNSGDGGKEDYYGENKQNSNSSDSTNYKKYDIVNINTATQTELESLPGIGPSLALKIIIYRKENGKFSSIEDIKNVNGIGENKFEKLKNYITI